MIYGNMTLRSRPTLGEDSRAYCPKCKCDQMPMVEDCSFDDQFGCVTDYAVLPICAECETDLREPSDHECEECGADLWTEHLNEWCEVDGVDICNDCALKVISNKIKKVKDEYK